jgi:hypothetical protein
MASQRDFFRKVPVHILNDCSDTPLVARGRFRISEKRLVVSSVYGCFDERLEGLADM